MHEFIYNGGVHRLCVYFVFFYSIIRPVKKNLSYGFSWVYGTVTVNFVLVCDTIEASSKLRKVNREIKSLIEPNNVDSYDS